MCMLNQPSSSLINCRNYTLHFNFAYQRAEIFLILNDCFCYTHVPFDLRHVRSRHIQICLLFRHRLAKPIKLSPLILNLLFTESRKYQRSYPPYLSSRYGIVNIAMVMPIDIQRQFDFTHPQWFWRKVPNF
jgi:hypothetical protein